jgi:hypothetical protein
MRLGFFGVPQVRCSNNRAMSIQRLRCLERQMEDDQEMAEVIRAKFRENVQNGFLKKLSPQEERMPGPCTWYLPVFDLNWVKA